ncbi:uncharacterized protein PFL1_05947 [Pseudozyma flocculosa PF-1]|uniref:Uncharacterized protein n=1 Tax=Pseudozyma flocculosa PF-1 TaxID=1277687 RepID=A0A061H7Q4_9BASI|nr:uncharacterized protein PFL1_05947 [Pseudozyma flocculosa PF-1]EPQ26626.1 hypothetical protein PFL1_05947 [Pseudozyma flocculosa PF-1]
MRLPCPQGQTASAALVVIAIWATALALLQIADAAPAGVADFSRLFGHPQPVRDVMDELSPIFGHARSSPDVTLQAQPSAFGYGMASSSPAAQPAQEAVYHHVQPGQFWGPHPYSPEQAHHPTSNDVHVFHEAGPYGAHRQQGVYHPAPQYGYPYDTSRQQPDPSSTWADVASSHASPPLYDAQPHVLGPSRFASSSQGQPSVVWPDAALASQSDPFSGHQAPAELRSAVDVPQRPDRAPRKPSEGETRPRRKQRKHQAPMSHADQAAFEERVGRIEQMLSSRPLHPTPEYLLWEGGELLDFSLYRAGREKLATIGDATLRRWLQDVLAIRLELVRTRHPRSIWALVDIEVIEDARGPQAVHTSTNMHAKRQGVRVQPAERGAFDVVDDPFADFQVGDYRIEVLVRRGGNVVVSPEGRSYNVVALPTGGAPGRIAIGTLRIQQRIPTEEPRILRPDEQLAQGNFFF